MGSARAAAATRQRTAAAGRIDGCMRFLERGVRIRGLHEFRIAADNPGMSAHPLDLTRMSAAIVDLDGTMVDTVGDFEQALARTLAALALPPVDRAFIARTVGRGSMHLLKNTLAQAGGAPGLLDSA